MSEITIHKKNDVYAYVECDRGIAEELSEFFSFLVPGYQFTPKFKAKVWDGKIHLFRTFDHTIYIGLASYIAEFSRDRGYSCSVDKNVLEQDSRIEPKLVNKFIDSLDIHCKGTKIDPYVYQRETIVHALKERRCIVSSPTGSGKSLVIYTLMRFIQNITNDKIFIIVPTTGLVYQMYSDFADYSSEDTTWDAEQNCHQIMSGRDKHSEKQIIISTWQAIFRMPQSYFQNVEAVMIDECHLATSGSLKGIMEKMPKCAYRYGLTGTLDSSKTSKLVLEGMFGLEYKAITTRKLMDDKRVADLTIKAIMLDYTQEEKQNMKGVKYQDEMKWLYTNNRRNDFIAKLAAVQKKNALLLFNHKSHGKVIYDKIVSLVDDKRKVYFVDGDTKAEERDEIRQRLEQEEDSILVASLGTTSTGYSVKNIHSVFFCSPTKSKIRTLQSIGRGLRISSEKTSVTLFDLCDDLTWKNHKNYSMIHFVERAQYYDKEKFDYDITRISI